MEATQPGPGALALVGASLRSVAVLRALPGVGDLLCAEPALRSLRVACPNAAITLLGLPPTAWAATRFRSLVDSFVPVAGWPGFPETATDGPMKAQEFFAVARHLDPDLVLQLHDDGTSSNLLAALIGSRHLAGHCPAPSGVDGSVVPAGWFRPYPDRGHEIRRLTGLLRWLGAPDRGEQLDFPLERRDRVEAGAVAGAFRFRNRPFVVVHPGAGTASRTWVPDGFAAVARWLEDRGYAVLVTGADRDRPLAAHLAQAAAIVDLTGRTSLGGFAALVDGAELVVTNDGGPSHLAAARRTPSVVLFTASDPHRWAPLDRRRHVAVSVGGRSVADVAADVIRSASSLLALRAPSATAEPSALARAGAALVR